MAIVPEGLILLEEPEVYQHPKALWQTALAILANVRRGVQVVVTTHSLELIDAILAEASEDDLEGMAVFNLLLEDGKLVKGHQAGEENDLR
jgi:predicted ATPase